MILIFYYICQIFLSDQDRNGTIDFREFIKLTHTLDINEQNDDERIFFGLIFDMFDRNHNG
jgi:Ca2+-binding EF-hand superfamily protein